MQIYDLSLEYEVDQLIEPSVIKILSKHLYQQKDIINGGEGGNGVDPYSRDMQEE